MMKFLKASSAKTVGDQLIYDFSLIILFCLSGLLNVVVGLLCLYKAGVSGFAHLCLW